MYFRHKLQQQFKLQDFKKEIDEVIILFNRQAERHISYLETLLEHPALKDSNPNPTSAPMPSNSHETLTKTPSPITPDSSDLTSPSSSGWHGWQKSLLGSADGDNENVPIPLAQEKIKAFHAHLGDDLIPSDADKKSKNYTREGHNSEPTIKPVRRQENTNRSKEQILIDKTVALCRRGLKPSHIAKELRISTAEVKLILELKERLILSKE